MGKLPRVHDNTGGGQPQLHACRGRPNSKGLLVVPGYQQAWCAASGFSMGNRRGLNRDTSDTHFKGGSMIDQEIHPTNCLDFLLDFIT